MDNDPVLVVLVPLGALLELLELFGQDEVVDNHGLELELVS